MNDRVMVFAPLPLLTVTVEQLRKRKELHLHAGGQGVWQARMLRVLGIPVSFCATVGGEVGRALEQLVAANGVETVAPRWRWSAGRTGRHWRMSTTAWSRS